ncbi:MAG: hypothetical protein ACRD3R_00270, partial [Terriglobales bacterium]
MVEIIIPLSIVTASRSEVMRRVVLVLEHEVHVARAPRAGTHCARDFLQDIGCGIIADRVHRIKAQAIEVEFFKPIEGIVDEKIAHGAT